MINPCRSIAWCGLNLKYVECLKSDLCLPPTVQGQSLPTITRHPTGDIYKLGSEVTLPCEAENANSIDWVHNGNTVVEDATRLIDATSSLVIGNLNDELTGSYACVAANEMGGVVSGVAEVQLAGERWCPWAFIMSTYTYCL